MKKIIISILLTISVQASSQHFTVDTLKLNSSYRELTAHPNSLESQQTFFKSFPSTWMDFMLTYRFDHNTKYNLNMYKLANAHMNVLANGMALIPDSVYCDKLIHISIGGIWEADAPNYFQELLHLVMARKTVLMFDQICKLSKPNQLLFWQFYWSSIHQTNKRTAEFEKLNKQFKRLHKNELKTMKIAYEYFQGAV